MNDLVVDVVPVVAETFAVHNAFDAVNTPLNGQDKQESPSVLPQHAPAAVVANTEQVPSQRYVSEEDDMARLVAVLDELLLWDRQKPNIRIMTALNKISLKLGYESRVVIEQFVQKQRLAAVNVS